MHEGFAGRIIRHSQLRLNTWTPKTRRVKIHREEMESLLNLKSKLDHEEAVSSYAAKYQQLGWVIQALNPEDGT